MGSSKLDNIWKKIVSEKASEVVEGEGFSPATLELLDDEMSPEELIQALSEVNNYIDAIKVMSRTLPPREAVWWACVCARQCESIRQYKSEVAALKAAEGWVYKPTEKNRLKAFETANECKAGAAGMLSALSATLSAGNLPLAGGEHLEKLDDKVFHKVVDGTILTSNDAEGFVPRNEKYQEFLDRGADIARGGSGKLEKAEVGDEGEAEAS